VNKREREKEKLIFFCFGYCSQPGFQSRRHHQAVWMFFSVLIIKLQKIFFFSIFIQSVVNCLPLHDALRLSYFLFVSCFYFNGTVCLISFYFYAYFSIYVSSFLAFSYSVFLILSEDVSSVFHLPKWYVFLLQLICILSSPHIFVIHQKDDFQISSPATFYFSLI
jgi:hypothetical protein